MIQETATTSLFNGGKIMEQSILCVAPGITLDLIDLPLPMEGDRKSVV